MFLDAFLRVSNEQAFGAAAVSTDSIDLGLTTPGRQIGTGEPIGFAFSVDVAGTVAASLIEIISATDAALTGDPDAAVPRDSRHHGRRDGHRDRVADHA
jgi:hypothetical protein